MKKSDIEERQMDMEAVRNYQIEMERIISKLLKDRQSEYEKGEAPTLLLHSCCAPCSSYCLEVLRKYFKITVFYYNPNISMEEEYKKRVAEQIRLIHAYNEQLTEMSDDLVNGIYTKKAAFPISFIEGDYDTDSFYAIARGLEDCKEGGERCFLCYELRLDRTAQLAKDQEYDFYTTTLTISPLKNAKKLNEIGEKLAKEYEIVWLPSDFKKKNGYKRSVELSDEYDLYRQDFCGCIYSKVERERQKAQNMQ